MPELDEFDDKIARVTPLGLSPVTDAQAMSALNQRVLDMMTNKVSTLGSDVADLAQERTDLKAEVARWEQAYITLFKVNEQHIEKIERLRSALLMIEAQKSGPYQNLYNNIRSITRAALEME